MFRNNRKLLIYFSKIIIKFKNIIIYYIKKIIYFYKNSIYFLIFLEKKTYYKIIIKKYNNI